MMSSIYLVKMPKLHVVMFLAIVTIAVQVSGQSSSGENSRKKENENSLGLSVDQLESLAKFKNQVLPHLEQEHMKEDFYLVRWLQAKDWKVADAEGKLMQHLQWRKQHRMDKIQEENWADMMREYPYETDIIDKEGRPVGTLSAKKWDIRRAVSQGRVPRLQRYMHKMLEDLTIKLHDARNQGKNVTSWSAVINADGFGLFQHACPSCIPVWTTFANSASEHYPGYAESIAMINVPRPLVRILRSVIASDLLRFFSSDKSSWMKYLDEKIDKDQRLAEYGGTKKA